jgi:alkyl hydroperoxide reductase subunit AhpC
MAWVPDGRSLVEQFKDQDFVLLGVNTDQARDDLAERTTKKDITWRSFADGGAKGPLTAAWGVTALPTTFLIDRKGVVRAIDLDDHELSARIEELLAETP